jgi:iron complex transport system permease protein
VNRQAAVVLLVALLVAVIGVALAVGPAGWRSPWLLDDVMLELRAPRVLLAAVVGASLAVAGVVMQALLRNALAEPYVLGLSGGASAGAVASLALLPALPPGLGAAAGATGAAVIVRALSRGAHDPSRLILAGVAVGSLLASFTGLVLVLAPGDHLLRSTTFWLFGGLGTPMWPAVVIPAALLVAITAWLLVRAERFDRLALGDDVAASLGVDVRRLRRHALIAAVVLTAAAVAAAGLVGFVGLVAPHAARRWVGGQHRGLLPVAAFGGALMVTSADVVARTAFAPREVPVGLLTAAVGGPFFLWQLQRGAR